MKFPGLVFLFFLAVVLSACSLTGADSATPVPGVSIGTPEVRAIVGHLHNQIETLEKNLPMADSQGYVVPTDAEKAAFAELVQALQAGNTARASQIAFENHYELVRYTDQDDQNTESYLLRELKPILKGWGLYLFRIGPAQNIVIEAPHPIADAGTPLVAAHAYRALQARALLVAGAHRDANHDGSADAAHAPQSIFQAIHEVLLKNPPSDSERPVVIQIHGFASSAHPQYPQIVLGYDKNFQFNPIDYLQETALVQKLSDALTSKKIAVGTCDGTLWQDLCGEGTLQANKVNNEIFIHLELDSQLRSNDKTFLSALKQAFPVP